MPVAHADNRRRRLRKFRLQHRLDEAAHPSPDSVLDPVEAILEQQSFGGHSRLLRGVCFVTAWSPFQRPTPESFGLNNPENANPIPTTSATGPLGADGEIEGSIMTMHAEGFDPKTQHTRRNVMKMGALLAPLVLLRIGVGRRKAVNLWPFDLESGPRVQLFP